MTSKQQLIDSLTSHISLYTPPPTTNPNPNPRSSILKWFTSLTIPQRQSHLTIVDPPFVQILLQMLSKLRSNGHVGSFIILPDIPSPHPIIPHLLLPSLCFRKSFGLLARIHESNVSERSFYNSIRLFSSKEGESLSNSPSSANSLDCLSVSEELVGNVEEFVVIMGDVSNGGFLTGEGSLLGEDWVELGWLKAKGYYSVGEFVANRLEVALRLAWLNCNTGRKRGVKLKEKANAAGVAANVFWRKKGCVDWWGKLDGETRRKVLGVAMGKAAKYLTAEILKDTSGALEDESWFLGSEAEKPLRYNSTSSSGKIIATLRGTDAEFGWTVVPASVSGKPSSLNHMFNSLCVLKNISTMSLACQHSDYDNLFFSSLSSVSTVSDCISRKLRGLLMVLSLDCTKIELLAEGNSKSPPKKSKGKFGPSGHRKKGKTRNMTKPNPVTRSSEVDFMLDKAIKDNGFGLGYSKNSDTIQSDRSTDTFQEKDLDGVTPVLAIDMESGEGLANVCVQSAPRKNRKGSNRLKSSSVESGICQTISMKFPSLSITTKGDDAKSDCLSENSVVEKDTFIGKNELLPNSSSCNFTSGPIRMDKLAQSIEGDPVAGLMPNQTSDSSKIENDKVTAKLGTVNHTADSSIIPPVIPVVEPTDVPSNEDINCGHFNEVDTKLVVSGEKTKRVDAEEKINPIQKQENVSVYDTAAINPSGSGYLSYEWPSVVHVPLQSVNSHIPATTDRLHLDVGHNWKNRLHPSFVQTVHQVRNPQIENGILSRPLPMSLDWPPMVRSIGRLAPSLTYNYDSGFISRRQSSFQQGFAAHSMQHRAMTTEDERMYSRDFKDLSGLTNAHEIADDHENNWISEDELEVRGVSGMDYNQYFGGGVMYWNPSDHPGTSFSRPPSLSSDDSSWAWREADMNRNVDDMVAFSSSYSTNGLTSPSAASFCSPFESLGTAHQALGYVIPGSDMNGKVLHSSSTMAEVVAEENIAVSLSNLPGDAEPKTGDSLPYHILRPIIVPNLSQERSRPDYKRSHDHKSPCVPPNRREQPRIKRPPSPIVLCVPHAPRLPPPSPVSDSRKHRGFPTVRSGSSSPRHWGVRGWLHDGINFEEACVRMDGSEVVWPSWRNKSLSGRQLAQPLPGALLQDRLNAISQLARDQEHPDVAFPLQPPEFPNCPKHKASLSLMHNLLHDEIDSFCKQVAAENLIRKPYINWAVKRVTRSLQVLWPRSRTNVFGSNATGLSLPTSDVDLVVCLPPVRNLEPIKEAGILEGRNGIKETCLQHAARYLANQEWVKNDSLKIVENTAIPVIMLVVEVPHDLIASVASNIPTTKEEESIQVTSQHGNPFLADTVGLETSASPKHSQENNDNGKDAKSIRIDISFNSPSHTGLQTTELVKELTEQFPAATPLALVLKQFLADRSLDQSYSGGLSSYCLLLIITRFLQHEHHHGRPINQNFGSLLMDFLYFFGNVFDPRQMSISVQGTGLYLNRERGYSIDPIYIDDPLFPTNNVGRNCFRIHQCIKSFADAYCTLENELTCLPESGDSSSRPTCKLLPKIIPSTGVIV